MPIDIETFEETSEAALDEPTNAERVLSFLVVNNDRAFTPAEIADGAGVDRGSIGTVLRRLEERDLVRHKSTYWAAGDETRIREAYDLHQTLAALDDQLGAEGLDEWRAHAADER